MWKLFDDLYIGIPSGIVITGCVIGKEWTTVRANGNIGIARTMEVPENSQELASQFIGQHLRDTACHMHWDSLAKASVGVAAMNAWYNTAERAEGLEGIQTSALIESVPSALEGKIATIGLTNGFEDADAFDLPMSPDFDITKYEPLKEYDNVVISGKAIITRALPSLLDIIGEDGNVILYGHSVPCSALYFAFDMPIREVRGFYQIFDDTVEACAVNDIKDPSPGLLPFCINPIQVKKIHESDAVAEAFDSNYNATKFNNNFNEY